MLPAMATFQERNDLVKRGNKITQVKHTVATLKFQKILP